MTVPRPLLHHTSASGWVNDPLVAARRIYLEAGFQLVAEEPHHSYGVDLVGQTYAREL